MAIELTGVTETSSLRALDNRPESPTLETGHDLGSRFSDFVQQVNHDQRTAEKLTVDYAKGRQHDLHGTMISLAKADISLRLLSGVRTKIIEAYREISRMGS